MILVLNAGSSSIKFALFRAYGHPDRAGVLCEGQMAGIGHRVHFSVTDGAGTMLVASDLAPGTRHADALGALLDWIAQQFDQQDLLAVGHRVVHGGARYSEPVVIDEQVMAELRRLIPLAPLHQPHHLAAINAVSLRYPAIPQVACFDTAFHHGQSSLVTSYALPRHLTDTGVRRYGFHGLSYEYIAGIMPTIIGQECAHGRVIVAHLGAGASLCALQDGVSIATTMGFTPLDGLPMGRRCGSLDPGVVLYLIEQMGMSAAEVAKLLYVDSGLLGVSGISDDMGTLLASSAPHAAEAIALFVYRIKRAIGSLAAALDGLDALIFTGGIGEHAAQIRRAICVDAAWLGVECDDAANLAGAARLSPATSRVTAWRIATDEDLMVARHTAALLARLRPSKPLPRNIMKSPPIAPASEQMVTLPPEDHVEHTLDEALAESFPSSDPVAVAIPKPSNHPL
ncbi:acetate kinase [Janthinobacterium sp. ROICE36]|uniref:acetate/propionate family kinase n=1 Tax=Janthinobacterium sp. ROICE36 TaxID=2048670 RepID=UPI000C7ECD47|nr:acetate/propionate family kinase [Janthinobacterium sp. ROICE36]PLY39607.1 acetate kinase [Janthinobacterium sp. ROICE36]